MNERFTVERTVSESDTAAALDPRLPAAASTPFLVHLGEAACFLMQAPKLGDGNLSVGVRVEIDHLEPSPVGAVLSAEAELLADNGRQQDFDVRITEGDLLVARVRHLRATVPEAAVRAKLSR